MREIPFVRIVDRFGGVEGRRLVRVLTFHPQRDPRAVMIESPVLPLVFMEETAESSWIVENNFRPWTV